MNKSLVLASLVAAVALAACGKKEEAPAAAAAPARRCRCRRRLPRPCRRRCLGRRRCCRRRRLGCRCALRPLPPSRPRTLPPRPSKPLHPRRALRAAASEKAALGRLFRWARRRQRYFSSSASTPTMRWPFSPASGAPCAVQHRHHRLRAVALQRHLVLDRGGAGVGAGAEELARRSRACLPGRRSSGRRSARSTGRPRGRGLRRVKPQRSSARPTRRQARSKVVVDLQRGGRLAGDHARARSCAGAAATAGVVARRRAPRLRWRPA